MQRKGDYFVSYVVLKKRFGNFTLVGIGNSAMYMEFDAEEFYDQLVDVLSEKISLKHNESLHIISINKL